MWNQLLSTGLVMLCKFFTTTNFMRVEIFMSLFLDFFNDQFCNGSISLWRGASSTFLHQFWMQLGSSTPMTLPEMVIKIFQHWITSLKTSVPLIFSMLCKMLLKLNSAGQTGNRNLTTSFINWNLYFSTFHPTVVISNFILDA